MFSGYLNGPLLSVGRLRALKMNVVFVQEYIGAPEVGYISSLLAAAGKCPAISGNFEAVQTSGAPFRQDGLSMVTARRTGRNKDPQRSWLVIDGLLTREVNP